jgi:hypothetical protein
MKIEGEEGILGRAYQSILVPLNSLLLVGIGVRETLNGTSVATEETVQVGTDLVSLALAESVALCAASLEKTSSLLCVSCKAKLSAIIPDKMDFDRLS